jgi:TM2 domain-containing membrane protein YozV
VQWEKARALQQNEKFYDAVTEYERLLFFDHSGKYHYSAYKEIGACYYAGAKIREAAEAYSKAASVAHEDSEAAGARQELIRMLLLERQYGRASLQISFYEKSGAPPEEVRFWRGWLAIFQDDWGKAAGCFGSPDTTNFLRDFCLSVQKKKYNRNLAELLSVFLPGAGQIYTGHYAQGAVSLGWNALWGYLTVKAFAADRVFDGVMTGSLLWLRFYSGGYQTAGTYADERNREIYNEALQFLERDYKGMKP